MDGMNVLSYGGVKPMKKKLVKSSHLGVDGKKKLVKVAKKVKVVAKPTKPAKPATKTAKPSTKRAKPFTKRAKPATKRATATKAKKAKSSKMDVDKEMDMSSLLKVLSTIKVTPLKKSSAEKMFEKMMSTFDDMGVKSNSPSPIPVVRKSTRPTKPIQRLQY